MSEEKTRGESSKKPRKLKKGFGAFVSGIGIRWKFFAYMMLFLFILLALLWCFQVAFFEEIYKNVKIAEIKRAAVELSMNTELDDASLGNLAERIASSCDVCVMIYDQHGYVRVSKHYVPDCSVHRMDDMNLAFLYYLAQKNGGERLVRYPLNDLRRINYTSAEYQGNLKLESENLGESLICTKVCHSETRNRDLVMILNATISPVGSTVRTLRKELLLISIAMTVCALVLSFLLARRVARPIVRINEGAKGLSEGSYDIPPGDLGCREINELSGTLKAAAEELSKTEALQRELIANISHDLRTPLTMIEGYAEVMRDIPGENTPENVQIIIDETKRLSSLVNDILDISKLQSGTQRLERTDFDLTETIREVIGRFSKLTGQEGWTIDFRADEEVMVNADRTRILQVIYNFINNAITHAGGDRTVIVTQRVIDDGGRKAVRIEVTDHGEGIPADKLPYIWDRYYKVDKTHRRAQTGSGLGLSIVKGILEMHGAKYGVESREGEGSTFWFQL